MSDGMTHRFRSARTRVALGDVSVPPGQAASAAARGPSASSYGARLRDTLVEPWLEPLTDLLQRAGLDRRDTRTPARLGLGVARGLLHDALVTGEFAKPTRRWRRSPTSR